MSSHYEEFDAFYRDLWGEHLHHGLFEPGDDVTRAVERLVERAAWHGGIGPGTRVCDIGSGYGATARLLASRYGARVTAMTISPAQHHYARHHDRGENPRYVLANWLENGLPAGEFDTALAIESTEHFTDLAAGLAEAHRVLKPGGRLVIAAWLASPRAGRLAEHWLLEPICREGRLVALRTPEEYTALLHANGFRLEAHEDLTAGVRRTWKLCLARLTVALCRQPAYWRYLLNAAHTERGFVRMVPRMLLAYTSGALRYGLLVAHRNPASRSSGP